MNERGSGTKTLPLINTDDTDLKDCPKCQEEDQNLETRRSGGRKILAADLRG